MAEADVRGGKRARVVGSVDGGRRFDAVVRESAEMAEGDEADAVASERVTRRMREDRVMFDGWNPAMPTVDYVNGGDSFDFDLNERTVDFLGVGENLRGSLDGGELGLGLSVNGRKGKEVICIDADGDDGQVQILGDGKFFAGGKESAFQADFGTELKLGMIDVRLLGEGSSNQRRYTREEKGKGIVGDNWLSIATENHKLAYSEIDGGNGNGDVDIHVSDKVEWNQVLGVVNGQYEDCFLPDVNGIHLWESDEYFISEAVAAVALLPPMEPPKECNEPPKVGPINMQDQALISARIQASRRREERRRYREIAKDNAFHLAHPQQFNAAESPRYEIEEVTGPFSMAMQKIMDHKEGKHKPRIRQTSFSIDWTPSRKQGCKHITAKIPSLLDLSIDALAKNAESIISLDPAPDALKQRISQAACDFRKMDSHLLEILVSDSPTEVYVKDCSWMSEEEFVRIFGSCDMKNLMSINLSQCSLLTACAISTLSNCLGSTLKELYIDDCQNIDALSVLPELTKFEHLEVLSVSGINTVSDEFIRQFIRARGSNLKELVLADCWKLTDGSLKVIGQTCPGLCALDISNLGQLTDATLEYITNGCRTIQKLKFGRNAFSDEAVASFLEVSGRSLKELSLNHVGKVGPFTALSLAKNARNLLNLDLSWCRKLTDAALGLVVDSCSSLRLLKLFGCTQVTEVFLNGHSNPKVEIIGLSKIPLLKQLNVINPQPGPLRYSPLRSLSNLGLTDD
uniref:Uncharacterized protein n=1 Tax=Kalanchoe fedtschenkoi TaxID=63787 RepID=A0A7N0U6Z9_KALFE